MTDSRRIFTGADYTPTIALVAFAFVFGPALLILSGPVTALLAAVGSAFSTLCLALAWVSWSRFSTLTIASVVR